MIIFAFIIVICIISIWAFLNHPKFGKIRENGPEQLSPNWQNGQFQNQHPTPSLTEGVSYYSVLKKFFFEKKERVKPNGIIPSIKTDLLSLDPARNIVVWFGHSSYFLQVDGKKILVDPVFSGVASPVNFTTRSFPGANVYTAADMPEIDYLFLSHDHWDHLDFDTILQIQPKIKKVITGLGTGAHLARWGYNMDLVVEKDWNETIDLKDGFVAYTTPARHFAGRGLKRNKALWISLVLQTPNKKIYLGGDSGYDTHFKEIGDKYGPFDLAILECGQYDPAWKYIHMQPEELPLAAADLRAKKLLPVHWAKFALGNHAWDDPIIRVSAATKDVPLLTPMIGEVVDLEKDQAFSQWWNAVDL